ncbi:hypothetical protein B194_1720 [Serratia plymuthica A30]|nr:hypothetical protein B194_1720 [Serratia plymuthica A30]
MIAAIDDACRTSGGMLPLFPSAIIYSAFYPLLPDISRRLCH